MDKNYLPGLLFLAVGIIALVISYSDDSGYRLVIRGTNISYGWFMIGLGVFRLILPPEE